MREDLAEKNQLESELQLRKAGTDVPPGWCNRADGQNLCHLSTAVEHPWSQRPAERWVLQDPSAARQAKTLELKVCSSREADVERH